MAAIAGAIIGGAALQAGGSAYANSQNRGIARANRRFQERMSNTAYQRAARDMDMAGLNRILALGSPASTPGGSVATMQNPMQGMAQAASSAIGLKQARTRMTAEVANMESQTRLNDENSSLARAQANKTQSEDGLIQAQTNNVMLQGMGITTANEIAVLNKQIRQLEIPGVQAESDFYRWLGSADATEVAKAAGKAGPLALQFIRAFSIISGKGR